MLREIKTTWQGVVLSRRSSCGAPGKNFDVFINISLDKWNIFKNSSLSLSGNFLCCFLEVKDEAGRRRKMKNEIMSEQFFAYTDGASGMLWWWQSIRGRGIEWIFISSAPPLSLMLALEFHSSLKLSSVNSEIPFGFRQNEELFDARLAVEKD